MKKLETKIYLEPDLKGWLEREAVRKHCSASQIVRDLICDKMLARVNAKVREAKR